MIVTAFSDTHGLHRKVKLPESAIMIFAGDAMTCGYKEHELVDFLQWYSEQPADNKVMVAGNHDRFIENHRGLFLEMLQDYPTIKYLEDDGDIINGLWIWGTPHSKMFCNWAFNRTEEQMANSFSKIPDDIDILVSHAPRYGVMDALERGDQVGEKKLDEQMNRLTHIRYHIFGHIHCQYGQKKVGDYNALNVSVVNEQYELTNQPISFKIYPHG